MKYRIAQAISEGVYNSITVDKNNNTYIVYYDADYEDLHYAVKK